MKKPKIVAILGSPRPQGNSSILAHKFLDAARDLGAETSTYQLNRLHYQGCQGCLACKVETEVCALDDDLGPLLQEVREADILLLASPVYFGDLSGQIKCFFDRTYSYIDQNFASRVPPGKIAVMVLVQANPDPSQFDDIFPRYQRWLKLFGFEPVHLLRATGARNPGDINRQPAVQEQAEALARELVGSS